MNVDYCRELTGPGPPSHQIPNVVTPESTDGLDPGYLRRESPIQGPISFPSSAVTPADAILDIRFLIHANWEKEIANEMARETDLISWVAKKDCRMMPVRRQSSGSLNERLHRTLEFFLGS